MTETTSTPLSKGDPVCDAVGRTDEDTPISLTDFEGRALAVFLCGEALDRRGQILIDAITARFKDFMRCNCSPIVVSGESVEVLGSRRESGDLPFVLISDPALEIHIALSGGAGAATSRGVWIVDENSRISAVVPVMPPREQISAVISALTSLSNGLPESSD